MQIALNLYPDDIDILLMAASIMATSRQKIGQRTLKDVLDIILQKEPENAQAQELLISEYINSENWNDAYNLSSTLINKNNYSTEILLQHIKSCIQMGLASEARNSINLLKTMKIESSLLELATVQVLIAEGKKAEAFSLIQRAISIYSGKAKSDFYYEKSRISANEEEKLSDLRLSLTANPRNPDALFSLYKYYFDKADYRKAQYYLRQVVALNPENSKLTELNAQLDSLIK
jgi:cytochrome c-type biogenesis protein CcmH/NrfG